MANDDLPAVPHASAPVAHEPVWQSAWRRCWQRPLAWLAPLLFALTCLRNTFAVEFPYLFGEDVLWTSNIFQHGYFYAAVHARADFPAFIQLGVLQLGLLLNKVLFGPDIAQLPLVIWVVANATLTLVALSPLLIPRSVLGTGYRALIGLMLALVPVGYSGNSIYGRALNLQWFLPVVMQFVLVRLFCDEELRPAMRAGLLAVALLLMLSFPVCAIQFACFAAWRAFRARADIRQAARGLAIDGVLVLLALSQVRPGASAESSAFPNVVDRSGLIEFALGRTILYPWIAPFYTEFTDLLVIVAGAAFGGLVLALWLGQAAGPRMRVARTILIGNTALVIVVTLATRRGLSAFYGDYNLHAQLDHYFLGGNMMVLALTVALVAGLRARPIRIAATALLVLVPASWVVTRTVPERYGPGLAMQEHGTLRDGICVLARQGGAATNAAGMVLLRSYPFWEATWTLTIPRPLFDATAERHCGPILPFTARADATAR